MTAPTKLPPSDTGACGTPKGHGRHKYRGERSCQPCREAENAHRFESRRARWGQQAPGPLPSTFGRFVGTSTPHQFKAMTPSQCAECWGWPDDVRHL